MKGLYYILAIAVALLASSTVVKAQEEAADDAQQQQTRKTPQASRGARADEKIENGLPELTVRAQDMNERLTQEVGNARWMRVIYREVDLTKEENAPLYYPVTPMNGQMNLFSTLFTLVTGGKVDAYEYLDGYEDFSSNRIMPLKDMLDRFYILYEETPAKGNEGAHFVINESDIPSESVRAYYVKEAWYFDQNNSVFDVKTLAICPIMFSTGDFGEQRTPMFWIPYENIRPYIKTSYIMTSNMNNATTFTLDDYFRRRMFKGDIFKTQNLMNQPLVAYCPTPDSLKREQERIEGQLITFEKSLYPQPDTTQIAADATTKKGKKGTASVRGQKTEAAVKEQKEQTVKTKAPKAQKSSPVRSVRRRR